MILHRTDIIVQSIHQLSLDMKKMLWCKINPYIVHLFPAKLYNA